MKKNNPPDGVPVWFDGKNINEALFCEEFLQTHKILFTNGAFFTPEGRVTDELPLRGEIFEELKCCAVSNIPRKISNIVELMKLAALVEEWNKLDRNRERRERDHENLRGDVPLEYQVVPEPKLIPRWMNNPAYRQLMAGDFLDVLFDCPYEMHQLSADPFISGMIENLSEEHKEVLYFLSLRLYSTTRLAAIRGESDRNIRKLRKTIRKKLQRQMYDHLCGKPEHSLTLRERQFLEEYSKIAKKQGKDAVIRRENKTKRRKKKNRP